MLCIVCLYESVKEFILMQEKTAVKEEILKQEEKYKWAIVDGVKKEVISSFVIFHFYPSFSPQYIFQSCSVFFLTIWIW